MSTRGLIAIMDDDGSCRFIYCTTTCTRPTRASCCQNTIPRARPWRLFSPSATFPPSAVPSRNARYCRDRGEELRKPTQWSDRWVLAREAFDRFWAEYCYLFMEGGWFCSDGGGWTPVADWLEQLGKRFYSNCLHVCGRAMLMCLFALLCKEDLKKDNRFCDCHRRLGGLLKSYSHKAA